MKVTNRWPARIALLITAGAVAVVMGAMNAYGDPGFLPAALQSATPSESPCDFDPLPPPFCPEPEESTASPSPSSSGSPKPSGSASPSGSPSPSPSEEPERHEANLTIKYPDPAFKGVVRTDNKCKGDREVVLRRIRKGPDTVIGRDTTGADGKWKVREPNADGRYYAKVLKRAFSQGGTDVICLGDRSKTLRV
jgi:hypothetical protein